MSRNWVGKMNRILRDARMKQQSNRNPRFEYMPTKGGTSVYLDGRRVGCILFVDQGYRYFPKSGTGGKIYLTESECRASLEAA